MFLSKIFSIFKKKKDSSSNDTSPASGSVVPPSGVGAAVGLNQPNQATTPDPKQFAQAPSQDLSSVSSSDSSEPSSSPTVPDSLAGNQDSDTSIGSISSDDTSSTQPLNDNQPIEAPTPQESSDEDSEVVTPDVSPEPPTAGDAGPDASPSPEDDNQNIAV